MTCHRYIPYKRTRIVCTGGSGFIGSNFIKYLLNKEPTAEITNIDNLTYAGQGKNIEHMGLTNSDRYYFCKKDIAKKHALELIVLPANPEYIIHFAAESHVDRSIANSSEFIHTNIVGTHSLLEVARECKNLKSFVQISTDEVYGSLDLNSLSSNETDRLNPRSPYSASKAAAEQLAMSYFHTHNLPVKITRSSNNYGPYQFPEKLVPLFITNLIDNKKVPLMHSKENPGQNIRDWLYVEDNCAAIWHIAQHGENGEAYNIGGHNERTNMQITEALLKKFNKGRDAIQFIEHRKAHDMKYSVDDHKLQQLYLSTGFSRKINSLEENLENTVEWYKKNKSWWRPLKQSLK